jgi:glycosyltransferase involved in cell wall biosynthesis
MQQHEHKLRIGIDADLLQNNDGMGTTARSLLKSLCTNKEIEVIHISNENINNNFFKKIIIKVQKKLMRIISNSYFDTHFENYLLPKIIRDKNIHIYHTLGGTLPKLTNCITVQTCYDISYHYDKDYLSTDLVNYYEKFVRKSALTATHVVTISESTKKDLMDIWKIPGDKISVIHLGVDIHKFSSRKIAKDVFRLRAGINFKYLLFVGNLNSRKNGLRLIESFNIITDQLPHLKLLIIGSPGELEPKMRLLVNQLNLVSKVLFLGRVDDDTLISYYQNAEVFCYPSKHEGFGLPILEAMAAGTPVLTSNSSSMREISGNAAVLVDPLSIISIADGIINALRNRDNLIKRGLEHVTDFTWENSAKKLFNLYQLLLSGKSD